MARRLQYALVLLLDNSTGLCELSREKSRLVTNRFFKLRKLHSETAGTNKHLLAGSHFCDAGLSQISLIHALLLVVYNHNDNATQLLLTPSSESSPPSEDSSLYNIQPSQPRLQTSSGSLSTLSSTSMPLTTSSTGTAAGFLRGGLRLVGEFSVVGAGSSDGGRKPVSGVFSPSVESKRVFSYSNELGSYQPPNPSTWPPHT